MERSSRRAIAAITSLAGYIFGFTFLGIWLSDNFFNNSGTVIMVSAFIGIVFAFLAIIRVVIVTSVNDKKNSKK